MCSALRAHRLRAVVIRVIRAQRERTQRTSGLRSAGTAQQDKFPTPTRPTAIRAAPATTVASATRLAPNAKLAFTQPQALALACTASPESTPPRVHRHCAHPASRVPSLRLARLSAILASRESTQTVTPSLPTRAFHAMPARSALLDPGLATLRVLLELTERWGAHNAILARPASTRQRGRVAASFVCQESTVERWQSIAPLVTLGSSAARG